MVDTLDLVVVGYKKNEHFLLASYDDNNDEYCIIGLIPADELPKTIKVHTIPHHDSRVICMYEADVWFYPELVVEVSCQSIASCISQLSPFFLVKPKFIKICMDKNAEHATTLDEVASIYRMQN